MRIPARVRALLLAAAAVAVVGALVASGTVTAAPPRAVTAAGVVERPVAPPARAARTRPVAPLRAVVVPDLLLRHDRALTPRQLVALRRIRGLQAFSLLSTGPVRVGTRSLRGLAVDPSSFRPFTPRETAASDPLWAAVARGDVAADYAARLPLGRSLPVVGPSHRAQRLPIGAVASYGVPGVDVVVSAPLGADLGLRLTSMLVSAPERSIKGLKADVREILGDGVDLTVLRPVPITYRRPATYRELYQLSAGYCPGLSWTVLAAIGQVESGHGRNVGPSTAGALGPMQFLPSTWAFAGVDGDGDGRADIMSAYDAVPAAALYLCRNGAGLGGQALYDAIFSYNHADWYVREVLDLAARYR